MPSHSFINVHKFTLRLRRYLKSTAIDAPIDSLTAVLPDAMPDEGIFAVDTAELFAALEGEAAGNTRSLKTMCSLLNIDYSFLHNAGNDAHVSVIQPHRWCQLTRL